MGGRTAVRWHGGSFFRLRDANICLRYGVGCGMMNRK